jgi:predicted transposase YbfD/YdcC
MEASVMGELARRLGQLNDYRRHNRRHPLISVLTIAVLAVLSNARGWASVARFAKQEQKWLELFLPLPSGVPSRQTFERVLAMLKPDELEKALMAWFEAMNQYRQGMLKHLALDGKALRHSYQHAWDSSTMAYLVSVFATENGLVLAQLEAQGRGGELAAIRKLLELVDIKDHIVTIDALGCQKDVAQSIVHNGGDYCLAVKDNQPATYQKIKTLLDEGILEGFAGWKASSHQSSNGGHGRLETRTAWVTSEIEPLGEVAKQWPALAAIAVVESRRTMLGKDAQPTRFRRYYLLSRMMPAAEVQKIVRGHWGIENSLHYILDVSYGEDASRIRRRSATNYSRLRRLTLNLLKKETSVQESIAGKRELCALSREYRLKVIAAGLPQQPAA